MAWMSLSLQKKPHPISKKKYSNQIPLNYVSVQVWLSLESHIYNWLHLISNPNCITVHLLYTLPVLLPPCTFSDVEPEQTRCGGGVSSAKLDPRLSPSLSHRRTFAVKTGHDGDRRSLKGVKGKQCLQARRRMVPLTPRAVCCSGSEAVGCD